MLWFCINKCMNYTASAVAEFFGTHEHLVSHNLVAHTKFRPCGHSQQQINAMAEEAKKDLRYGLNCFAKSLYPNHTSLVQRKPHIYRPLTLVTIENIKETTDPQQTIHFNISFGNIPKHMCTNLIEVHFRHAWVVKANQQNDIYITHKDDYPANPQKWFGYTLKEATKSKQLAWDTNGTWDVLNTWIPSNPINTD
jgi:hypothetical protein